MRTILLLVTALFLAMLCTPVSAQVGAEITTGERIEAGANVPRYDARQDQRDSKQDHAISRLESELRDLRSDSRDKASSLLVLFLFGAFCAVWAQNTGRSALLWFFLGLFFSVITVLFLLAKNRRED